MMTRERPVRKRGRTTGAVPARVPVVVDQDAAEEEEEEEDFGVTEEGSAGTTPALGPAEPDEGTGTRLAPEELTAMRVAAAERDLQAIDDELYRARALTREARDGLREAEADEAILAARYDMVHARLHEYRADVGSSASREAGRAAAESMRDAAARATEAVRAASERVVDAMQAAVLRAVPQESALIARLEAQLQAAKDEAAQWRPEAAGVHGPDD
jgi:hypothetical protein